MRFFEEAAAETLNNMPKTFNGFNLWENLCNENSPFAQNTVAKGGTVDVRVRSVGNTLKPLNLAST